MKKLFFSLLMLLTLTVYGQNKETGGSFVEMADKLREDGKIWVVVTVVLVVLFGLLTYVILLDRKISKIEREVKSK